MISSKPKLLVLYARNHSEVFNRKSALGSYIHCLSVLLSKDFNVWVNGEKLSVESKSDCTPTESGKIPLSIKNIVPKFIKRYFRDKQNLQGIGVLKNRILSSEKKFDAILEFYSLGSDVGTSIAKKQNIPLNIIYDGPILEEYQFFNGNKPFFFKTLNDRLLTSLKSAKSIVAYSKSMQQHISNLGVDKNKILIHQNVDFSRFELSKAPKNFETELNICFIGSFLKWHQVELLIAAFNNLRVQNMPAKLYLVGHGQEIKSIQKIAENSTYRKDIIFTGFLDGTELKELKENMHIGVMSGSNWYGAPNKIFEYGAMKLAVVAPNTPTISDNFSSDEICFFEWKNGQDLSKKLIRLCRDTKELNRYSNNLHNKIKTKYSPGNTSAFYTEILNKSIKNT